MRHHTKYLLNDRGNAMIISLLMLLVLSAVGLGYVMQSKTETQIAGNDMRWSQSLYSSEAGVSEALLRMRDSADSANYIGETPGSETPGWGVYIVSSNGQSSNDPDHGAVAADGLDNDGDGDVDEDDEAYPEIATKQSGNQIPYSWVRVEYVMDGGQVVLYGDHDNDPTTVQAYNFTAGAPVIRVTSRGTRGNAQRRIEVEAVKPQLNMVHAAVYAEDDNFKFNGTQFLVSGQDWDPLTDSVEPGSSEVPGIATTQNTATISDALGALQQNNVEGSGAEPSVDDSPIDLDLEAMAADLAGIADRTLPTGSYGNVTWGDWDNYEITHITGDLHGSGGVLGGGILVVDGDFVCTGQMTWYGLVIVLGDMTFSGGGAEIHIFGSTLVQGGIDQQTVGGNADLKYSSAAIDKLKSLGIYTTISWLEL